MNIFLAPRANETSHENFESTIIEGRPYTFVERYLTDTEKAVLSTYETVRVWGNKESLKARWEKMEPGDYVLFYANKMFYYSARVVLTKYSPELGEKLWPADEDGSVWSCLFFIDQIKETQIPIKVVQELAEYDPAWDRVQGFMPLNDEGITAITEKFGSIESFIGQDPAVYTVIDNIIERERDEIVEGTKEAVADIVALLAEINAYKDSGPSHTIETTTSKKRLENKAQKRKIAQIEGYACQICNWSLEWTNSKGELSYRIDVDHIIDKAKGGGEEAGNLWALCPNCHVKKTLGVLTINPVKKQILENGREVTLHHDEHLKW